MPSQTPPRAWQRMLSGRRLDLVDPSPVDIELADIAHGLARVARWNGQTLGAHVFSVAQHTLLVDDILVALADTVEPSARLAGLLHDSAEYVIGDLISPFKALLGGEYRAVEARLLAAIHRRFAIPHPLSKNIASMIKAADRISAYHEAVELAGFGEGEAVKFFGRPKAVPMDAAALEPWPTTVAERRYLDRFAEVQNLAGGGRP
ncbi:MAG: hydrolase [Alphaproteobacteria bacterium]